MAIINISKLTSISTIRQTTSTITIPITVVANNSRVRYRNSRFTPTQNRINFLVYRTVYIIFDYMYYIKIKSQDVQSINRTV